MPAHTMSNPFYKVHPRRNDRLVAPSAQMRRLCPGIDFRDIHYVRHLLAVVQDHSRDTFDTMVAELRALWLKRMRLVIGRIPGPVILVLISDNTAHLADDPLGGVPLFVQPAMVEDLARDCDGLVCYDATATHKSTGTRDMVFNALQARLARRLLPPACHNELAEILKPVVGAWMGRVGEGRRVVPL